VTDLVCWPTFIFLFREHSEDSCRQEREKCGHFAVNAELADFFQPGMDGRALESPTLRTDKAEVVEDASNKVTNEKATNEIQLGEASVRESSSESRESEWSSEVNHGLREGSSADRTLELCKTLIRWIGCAVLLTASLLRFSVLSLPYFLLFLLNFLHITKNYFQYYLPQKKSIVLLGALSTYSFSCIIFELVIAILLGTGKYVPTTTTLRSLESVGVADFHKSVSAGLRGILPDIFVFVFAFTSLFINWFLWKKIIPVSFNNLSEQANPLSSSLPSIVRLQGQILDQRGDFVSRSVPPKVAVVCFYSFLFLLSLTFASVATAIAMLVVDFVLLAWCLGPVTFARWSNVLVEDDKLKEASYYERRLLAQVPPSLPDRLVAKVLSFFKVCRYFNSAFTSVANFFQAYGLDRFENESSSHRRFVVIDIRASLVHLSMALAFKRSIVQCMSRYWNCSFRTQQCSTMAV
jgi:hypothetical protein